MLEPLCYRLPSGDELIQCPVGALDTNCYIYLSGKEALVIDCGAEGARVATLIPEDIELKAVLATHGHPDHISGVVGLLAARPAPFMIHQADEEQACHAHETLELRYPIDDDAPQADAPLLSGSRVSVGTAAFEVIEAPGHTPGGVILRGTASAEGIVFVGDTLFAGSCGRTDLAGGSTEMLRATLKHLVEVLHPEEVLCCGHGELTTVGRELQSNPCLQW